MRSIALLLLLALGWALASRAFAADAAPGPAAGGVPQEAQMTATTTAAEFEQVVIDMQIPIAAPPAEVYEAFVGQIAHWWDKGFLMAEGTTDIVLEARPGGLLFETDGQGGGCVWAQVIALAPGKSIRLGVPNGVIWAGPGYYSLKFDDAGDGSTLVVLHHESTQPKSQAGDGHSGYAYGWNALLVERLKPFVEQGSVPDPLR
jgi:uncharacterized protein YndB with AHSA1/START domain